MKHLDVKSTRGRSDSVTMVVKRVHYTNDDSVLGRDAVRTRRAISSAQCWTVSLFSAALLVALLAGEWAFMAAFAVTCRALGDLVVAARDDD